MKTFEARITPKGKQGFDVRVQAKNEFEAKRMLQAQYPGASIMYFKEIR